MVTIHSQFLTATIQWSFLINHCISNPLLNETVAQYGTYGTLLTQYLQSTVSYIPYESEKLSSEKKKRFYFNIRRMAARRL